MCLRNDQKAQEHLASGELLGTISSTIIVVVVVVAPVYLLVPLPVLLRLRPLVRHSETQITVVTVIVSMRGFCFI